MGCGLSVKNQVHQAQKSDLEIPQGLIRGIKENNQIIVALSDTSIDQKSNLMNSFQFFNLNARYLWKIANDREYCNNSIDLILTCMEDLLKVLPIYIKSNINFTLYVCQILSSYSIVLFQFFATNGQRYLEISQQKKYQNYVTVTEQQLQIERENDPQINVVECLLFQVKAAINLAPTDSKEGTAILKQFLGGALKAGLSFTLNDDLTESLMQGIIYIYNEYKKSQMKRKFELIYYITGLKYSVLDEIEEQNDISKIMNRISEFHQKIIKNCVDWEIQCCWIQSLSAIINHRFTIKQNQIEEILSDQNIENQFIIKIKDQQFVSINSQDIQNNPNAKKIFQQIKQLQSLSKLQFLLVKGSQEFNGFEKIYKMKMQLQKQERSLVIDKSILSSILMQIKNLLIRQNKINNRINDDANKLDQTIGQQIEDLFTLQSTIHQLSQCKSVICQENKSIQSDDQLIASIYYFRDVLKIQDEKLKSALSVQDLSLVLNGNIQQSSNQLTKNEREVQLFELQNKLQTILDKYQQSINKESILFDLHCILEILDKYEGLLYYNITQLQYLQIGYRKMDKIEFYDYDGLQKTTEQLHRTLQIAETYTGFKSIHKIQESKIKIQLNLVIIGKIQQYNFKVENLQQVIDEPNAIEQIQKLTEISLKDIDQQLAALNMIISTIQCELDTQIDSQNLQKSLKEEVILEIIQIFKQGIIISKEQLISIQQQIEIYTQQIRQDVIIQKNQDNHVNVQDHLQNLQRINEQLNNISNFQIMNTSDEEFIQCLYKEIILDLETIYRKCSEQIQGNQINLFDSQKERDIYEKIVMHLKLVQNQQLQNMKNISEYIILRECVQKYSQNLLIYQKQNDAKYQENIQNTQKYINQCKDKQKQINMSFKLNIAEMYEQINTSNKFVNYPKEVESQIIMMLKSISKTNEFQQQSTFFDNIAEQIEDTLNGSQWRIRQIIIYELLQMESNLLLTSTSHINIGLQIKFQVYETDYRIKRLFENSKQIKQQNQLMKQYWPTVEEQVYETIKGNLVSLNKLLVEISSEKNTQVKQRKQQQFKQLQQEINDQIQNVSSITSSLGITVLFLQDLKADLGQIQNTLNQLQQSVTSIGNDLKALRGRTFQELLELRMRNIFQSESTTNNNNRELSVYIPIKGKEKNYTTEIEENDANLFTEDFFGEGKVNEFIWRQNKDSLLIHGMAGSGKSTAVRRIEQFLWKIYEIHMDQTDAIPLVPIYISLPSLKDPISSAVVETLKSDNYRFADRQVEEFKEAVESGRFRIIFIMDSYDEIKQQYLGLNLNVSNKLSKWRNPKDKGRYPKVITTSRTELFNKKGYFTWFISESNDLKLFKEVRLIQFDDSQINQYIQEYCQLEAMKIVSQFGQIQDIVEFKQCFNQDNPQIEKFISKECVKQVEGLLQQLWRPKQYLDCIAALQLEILLVTPFMMEIVLVVLPRIINGKKQIDSIKNSFIQRYSSNEMEGFDAWQLIISNSQFVDEYQVIQTQAQMDQIVYKYFNAHTNYKSLQQALVIEPLTSFDFYIEFFENYFNRQIQKLKEQGECPEIKEELWEFAHQLANQMTFNNLSQVQFQQSGLVFKKKNKDWRDLFFDDDCPEGKYKKLFRKCIPLNQKNGTYSFNHKSLQEFLVAKWFIQRLENLEEQDFFSQYNWDQEYLKGPIRFIVDKLKHNEQSQKQLFRILLKTKDNENLIQAGSNSMLILYQSEYNFRSKNLSQIHLKDINLAGINFYASNLEKSCFENVNLSYSNLSMAKLINCKWDPIKINERPTLTNSEDKETITQMLFLNNNESLLSLNYTKAIKLWSITEAKQVQTNYFLNLKINLVVKSIKDKSNLIALVDEDNIYIFDTNNHQMTHTLKYSHLIQIDALAFNCDDTALILGGSALYRFNIPQNQIQKSVIIQPPPQELPKQELPKNTKMGKKNQPQEIQMIQDIQVQSEKHELLKEQIIMLADQTISSIKASQRYILATEKKPNLWIFDQQENSFLVQDLYTNQEIIYSSSITIDGSVIATGGFNKIINLYQIDKLDTPKYLQGHTDKVTELEFFSSNKYLVSGSFYDQSIRLWDIQTSIQLNQFQVDFKITQFAIQFDSMLMAVGTRDGVIQLYDMEQSGQMNVKIQGHSEPIQCCDSSNDGVMLASGSYDKTIKLWSLSSGLQIGKDMKKHIPQSLGFTKNDQFLFSGDEFGMIIQWDVSSQMLLKEFQNFGDSILDLFAIDSNSIITRSTDLTIKFWNFNEHTYQIFTNCLEKQFDYLDGVANCNQAKEFEFTQDNILTLNKQIITAILLTKDQRFKVLGTNDGELIFIDTHNFKRQEKCHNISIAVIVQLDQESVISATADKKIAISNFKSGLKTKYLQQAYNSINDIVLSKDLIISCDYSIMIQNENLNQPPKYLELKEPQKILTLHIHKNILYSGTEYGMLYTWDLDIHKQINELKVSQWNITKIKYLPQRQELVASSSDGNIYFIENNQIKLQFTTGDPIQFMEISNDEQLIALGHQSYLSLWDLQKQLKIDNFGYFKKIEAMLVKFEDCLALVSDQNSLIKVPLSLRRINQGIQQKNGSYVTCATVYNTELIVGDSKGRVFNQNINEPTSSSWQGEQQEIVKINYYWNLVAVGYRKGVKIINWNTKQTIYENQLQELMGSLQFINYNFIVYSIQTTIYVINIQSKEIKEINQHLKLINGVIANKDHFISFGIDKMIRVYENHSQTCKFIFSIVQKLECDQTIIQASSSIKTTTGFDLKQLFRQRGAS